MVFLVEVTSDHKLIFFSLNALWSVISRGVIPVHWLILRLSCIVEILSHTTVFRLCSSLPVLLKIWPNQSVLSSKHILLVLTVLIRRVHIDIDILSDGLVCIMLDWLAVYILELRTNVVSMHSSDLSCLVSHLIELIHWDLESTRIVEGEVLSIRIKWWSSKLWYGVIIIHVLEYLCCILATKGWCIRWEQSIVRFVDLFNCLEIWHHWLIICEEVSIKWLNLDLVMNSFLRACIRVNVVHLGHWLVFSTLRSSDPLEVILIWFHLSVVCVSFLFIHQLLQLLLFHLLLQKLFLFGECKLFVTACETESTMSIGWGSDELLKVSSWWRRSGIFIEYLVTLSETEWDMLLFTWA